MDQPALEQKLKELITAWESEVVEFKEASNDYDTGRIGQYFSALSNEANLHGVDSAWLVFGVNNKTRSVVGTSYRDDPERLQSLKHQIVQSTAPNTTFRNIHELNHKDGRVVMMEVPAAPQGMPIAWSGHWFARAGESLCSLGIDKLDAIRAQTAGMDWTAQVVEGATLDDLDTTALDHARQVFASKHANRFSAAEVAGWPIEALLDRARVTQRGKITRTALLLLGKAERAFLLSPHPAQMTWSLVGAEIAYEHFSPPFLLTTTALFQKIRNFQLRILPDDELLPYEVAKYDQQVVLEALHNCIAHQDYRRGARIIVTEQPDRIVFENQGGFFEGKPEDYVAGTKTPHGYRNPYLVQAMVELNMIDQMGYGIRRMHEAQRRRYFPMPDYDLSGPDAVRMTIHGGVVDPAYSRHLMENSTLSLLEVLALDRVQKRLQVPDETIALLRRKSLVEGRKPNFRVTAAVAAASSRKAEYIRNRAFDDHHYEELVVEFLRKFGQASRKEIDGLLWSKLSDSLGTQQKSNKIGNLLSGLRRNGLITNAGSKAAPKWVLADRSQNIERNKL